MASLAIWLQASRPKTLPAAIVPVLLGLACASRVGAIPWPTLFLILFAAIFIQIGTNLANDYSDFKSGADTAQRAGPVRVTQAGLLRPAQVKGGANLCFVMAFLLGIPLMLKGGWPIIAIGLSSILCGWLYTGGPYPLGYNGLGELFVLLFFGFAAVMGTDYLLTGSWHKFAAFASLAPGLHSAALLAANNYRDYATDITAQKHTLAVRFGERFSRIECVCLLLLPFLLPLYMLLSADYSFLILLPLAALISAWRPLRIYAGQADPLLRQAAFVGVARTLLIYGLLLSAGVAFG